MMTDIDIINRSTVLSDADAASMVPALQKQISRDFAPLWGADATLHFVGAGQEPTPSHWACQLLDDDPGASGDLGYHVDDTGIPTASIFLKEDLADNSSISVTISHELLEMLADPTANNVLQGADGRTYILEVADPCESDADGYDIDGVRVSDFVLPAYYGRPNPDGSVKYDFRGLLAAGLPTLRPGGYIMFEEPSGGPWQSTMARHEDGSFGRRAMRQHGRSRYRAART